MVNPCQFQPGNLGLGLKNAAAQSDGSAKNGLFNGQYGAPAQLVIDLSPPRKIGVTDINAYSPFPSKIQPDLSSSLSATGSNLANTNFGTAVSTNAFGFSGNITLNSLLLWLAMLCSAALHWQE